MAKYIRVENNQVVECIEYLPENTVGDWREAIEIHPILIPTKQIRGAHTFDLSKTPAEIVWEVIDLTLEQRKSGLLSNLNEKSHNLVKKELVKEFDGQTSDFILVQNAISSYRTKRNQLLACSTHEEIDSFISENT